MRGNQALLQEAQELVAKRCISQNRGVVAFCPPGHEELIRLVAEAIEQGRTSRRPERVDIGPEKHRLEFVEFNENE